MQKVYLFFQKLLNLADVLHRDQNFYKVNTHIFKAIEQGIITEATKTRLTELEKQLTSLEFEIAKEKARSYTYLTVEQIEMYLSKFVLENTDDIKVRKLIVNAFVREIILYEDEIVITYTFTDNPEYLKRTKATTLKTENQIEQAEKSASSYIVSSSIFSHFPPQKYRTFVRYFFMWDRGFPRFHRGVALQHEPLRANASKREQVHFLRYYGSVQVASYESPYPHQSEYKLNPSTCILFLCKISIELLF